RVSQQLTLSTNAARVLGFESAADWSVADSLSATHSEGESSVILGANGWTETTSIALATLGDAAEAFSVDIWLPLSTTWGEVRLILKLPSQSEPYRDLGGQPLAGLGANNFHTLTFAVPSDLRTKLAASYSDLTFTVVVNAPSGDYLLDRLDVGQDG